MSLVPDFQLVLSNTNDKLDLVDNKLNINELTIFIRKTKYLMNLCVLLYKLFLLVFVSNTEANLS